MKKSRTKTSRTKTSRTKTSRTKRKSPTKGWKKLSKGKKEQLKTKCGSRCFLEPKKLKYPICDSLCNVSCKGVVSAKVRSAQWKNTSTYNKASRLVNKYKCTAKSR